MTETELDAFDRALLGIVQRDNLTPARVMAERIGLSESAVLRRLRRLRDTGVIARDVSIVRQASLGRPLTLIVLVNLVREGLSQIDEFATALKKRPEVVSAWYVTGEADFVLILQLADMAEYEVFTHEVFLSAPNVRGFKTMASMRELLAAPSAGHTRV